MSAVREFPHLFWGAVKSAEPEQLKCFVNVSKLAKRNVSLAVRRGGSSAQLLSPVILPGKGRARATSRAEGSSSREGGACGVFELWGMKWEKSTSGFCSRLLSVRRNARVLAPQNPHCSGVLWTPACPTLPTSGPTGQGWNPIPKYRGGSGNSCLEKGSQGGEVCAELPHGFVCAGWCPGVWWVQSGPSWFPRVNLQHQVCEERRGCRPWLMCLRQKCLSLPTLSLLGSFGKLFLHGSTTGAFPAASASTAPPFLKL